MKITFQYDDYVQSGADFETFDGKNGYFGYKNSYELLLLNIILIIKCF